MKQAIVIMAALLGALSTANAGPLDGHQMNCVLTDSESHLAVVVTKYSFLAATSNNSYNKVLVESTETGTHLLAYELNGSQLSIRKPQSLQDDLIYDISNPSAISRPDSYQDGVDGGLVTTRPAVENCVLK